MFSLGRRLACFSVDDKEVNMSVSGLGGSGASLGMQMEAALLRKTRDVQEMKGEQAVKLIEQTAQTANAVKASSAHPHVGSTLDVYA